jgi:ketosteroid isomerase-like protein
MKKMLFLSVVLICAMAARPQETQVGVRAGAVARDGCTDAADAKAIRQIAGQWKNGYNNGDAASVESLYADDADYLTQHFITGIIHGRAAIQAYVQRGIDAHYHIDSIQIISMGCSGDIA